MIPVDQTRFDGPAGGNCLAACVASILELPVEAVESESLSLEGVWEGSLRRLLQSHGYQSFHYATGGTDFPQIFPRGYHIACNASHATVALDGYVVHDPHPKRVGLKEITEWILLLPLASQEDERLRVAREIVAACTAHLYYSLGICDEAPPSLKDFSLAQLAEAQSTIAAFNDRRSDSRRTMVMDPRGVAALYVAYHFAAHDASDCEAVAIADGRAVLVVRTPEER